MGAGTKGSVRIRDLVPAPPLQARMRGGLQSLLRTSALGQRLSGSLASTAPPPGAPGRRVRLELRVAEREGSVAVRLLPAAPSGTAALRSDTTPASAAHAGTQVSCAYLTLHYQG